MHPDQADAAMILDLFAGPGGWSEGLRLIGLSDLGLEWDRDACRTRAAAGHKTIRCDVAGYPVEPFVGKVRGLIASPPCQAFSMAGKRQGMLDLGRIHAAVEAARSGWRDELREGEWADPRSALILEPLRWAWALRPEWVACEQVPPALPVWEHMADVLRAWGYDAKALRLLAADYGVPQTRLRAFLLAHRERVRVPEPTHAKNPEPGLFGQLAPWVSMAEALGWDGVVWTNSDNNRDDTTYVVPTDEPGPTLTERGTRWRVHPSAWGECAKNPGNLCTAANCECSPRRLLHAGAEWALDRRVGGYAVDAAAIPINRPAPTLSLSHGREVWTYTRPATAVCGDPRLSPPGYRGKPEDYEADGTYTGERSMDAAVRITLEEAAILQSFRADYPFRGTKTAKFRQVGDAVPPLMAAAIVETLAA